MDEKQGDQTCDIAAGSTSAPLVNDPRGQWLELTCDSAPDHRLMPQAVDDGAPSPPRVCCFFQPGEEAGAHPFPDLELWFNCRSNEALYVHGVILSDCLSEAMR